MGSKEFLMFISGLMLVGGIAGLPHEAYSEGRRVQGAQARQYRSYDFDIEDLIRAESDPDFERHVRQRVLEQSRNEEASLEMRELRERDKLRDQWARDQQRKLRVLERRDENELARARYQHRVEKFRYRREQDELRRQHISARDRELGVRAPPSRLPAALSKAIEIKKQLKFDRDTK